MSSLLLSYHHQRLREATALLKALAITSLVLLRPSLPYRFRPYFFITALICIAVGRTDLNSFRTNRLMISMRLTCTYRLRYLSIQTLCYGLIFTPLRELRMTNGPRWEPAVTFGSEYLTDILIGIASELTSHTLTKTTTLYVTNFVKLFIALSRLSFL